ncbi:hypothetical protein Aduo_002620 [Ancylostoma duodenale]
MASSLIILCLLGHVLTFSRGGPLTDDIYVEIPISSGAVGYRLFNGTHQFGFHTSEAGSHGVVVFLKKGEVKELRDCWRERFDGYDGKYHVVLPADMIDNTLVSVILKSDCIAGLIVLDPEVRLDPTKPLSHDCACPNPTSGMYSGGCSSENAWNERGYILPGGLRDIDWRMQILYMYNQTHLETVKKCHDLFNVPKEGSSTVSSPFCAASYGTFNRGAGSTEICLRRGIPWNRAVDEFFGKSDMFCSYLFGVNLIAFLPPKIYKNSSSARTTRYLMLAVRQDSFGLIPQISPGEISVLTSIIAILAAARGIGLHASAFEKAAKHSDRHVIIAFFDGESFEYIGSSDVEYTMGLGFFPEKIKNNSTAWMDPIEVSQLDGIVEIQQLGTGDGKTLNGLFDGHQFRGGQLRDLLDSLSAGIIAAGGSLVYPTADSRMPPSSWYSFARVNPSIKGVVLAPFRDKYEYRRVNSMLDRAGWTVEQRSAAISEITLAASAVLRAAADYVHLDPSVRNSLAIDRKFVSDLTECFIVSQRWTNCSFFAKMEFEDGSSFFFLFLSYPLSIWLFLIPERYLGKSTYVSKEMVNMLRPFIEYALVYAIGSTANTSNITDEESCAEFVKNQNDLHVYMYSWQADPYTGVFRCYRSPYIHFDTISPAFQIEDYDFKNTTYSTWAESVYKVNNLRLYLVQDESYEYIMLLIGIVFAVVSFLIVGRCNEDTFVNKREEHAEEE